MKRQSFAAGWAKLQEVLVIVDDQAGEMMNEFQLDHLKDILVTKDDKQVHIHLFLFCFVLFFLFPFSFANLMSLSAEGKPLSFG